MSKKTKTKTFFFAESKYLCEKMRFLRFRGGGRCFEGWYIEVSKSLSTFEMRKITFVFQNDYCVREWINGFLGCLVCFSCNFHQKWEGD